MGLELARAFVVIGADSSGLMQDLRDVRASSEVEFDGIAQAAGSAAQRIQATTGAASLAIQAVTSKTVVAIQAMFLAANSAINFFAVRTASNFEQIEISFKNLLGSATETADVLDRLTEFASKTPFRFPEILQSAKSLIQFGERGEELMETMRILGNAAAASGTRFRSLALIFEQVRGAGKLLRQDFNQLATRGIVTLQDLANHFGVTSKAADEMLSKGKISFGDLREIFVGLSAEGGRFEDLMENLSGSFSGMVTVLQNKLGILIRQFGETLLPMLKAIVAKFIVWADWMQANGRLVLLIVTGLQAFLSVIFGVITAIRLWTLAIKLNITFLAIQQALSGPAGWALLAVAIGVATAAVLVLNNAFDDLEDSQAAAVAREKVEGITGTGGVGLEATETALAAAKKKREEAKKEREEATANLRAEVALTKRLRKAGASEGLLEGRKEVEFEASAAFATAIDRDVAAIKKLKDAKKALEEAGAIQVEVSLFRTGPAAAAIENLQNAVEGLGMGLSNSTLKMLEFARSTGATIAEQREFMDLLKQQAALVIAKNLEEMNVQLLMTEDRFTTAQRALAKFASQKGVTDAQIESFEKMQKRLQELDARSTLDDMAEELFLLRNSATAADRAMRAFATREGVTREQTKKFREMRTEADKLAKALADNAALKKSGEALTKSLRTPFQIYRDEVMRINEMLAKGFITQEIAVKAVLGAQKKALDQQKLIGAGRSGFVQFGKSIQDAILQNTDKDFKREQIGLLKAGLKKQDELIKAVEEDKNKPAVLI